MAIAMKDFAAMLRRKGGSIGAAKVADILDDCDRAAIALEEERDTLRARVAELEGLLAKVQLAHDHQCLNGEMGEALADRITSALEASGIDGSNVKDGEG